MDKFPEQKWLAAGFTVIAIWLGISSWASHQNTTELVDNTQKSLHSYETIKTLRDVYAAMAVMESGRRGYVFWGDRAELKQYNQGLASLQTALDKVQQLVMADPSQTQQFFQLRAALQERISLLQLSISLYNDTTQNSLNQRKITDRSLQLRDRIQHLMDTMQQEEERRLRQWLHESQVSAHQRLLIEMWLTFSVFFALALGSVLFYRQLLQHQRLEAAQDKLAQQQELSDLKLNFFSMVSHEFRTPLSVILGSSQLLTENYQQWDDSKCFKSLLRIQSSAKVMTQLLTDILTFTRAEAGKLEYQPEWVELESFCLNLVEDMMLANPQDHPLRFLSHCKTSHAFLDEKLMYATLSNLLLNAVKYSPIGCEVHLILESDPTWIIFQIQDRGIGIPQEDLEHLYEPFHRGRNVASVSGTGLGLAVVKKCVDLHQGEILVETQEGEGTTFTVKIPRDIQI